MGSQRRIEKLLGCESQLDSMQQLELGDLKGLELEEKNGGISGTRWWFQKFFIFNFHPFLGK